MYTGLGLSDLGLTPDCLSPGINYEWVLAKLPVVHIVTLLGGEMPLVTSCHK